MPQDARVTPDEAIERALREVGLGPEHAAEIRAMLAEPEAARRACCGGFCDPCVTVLERALERARALIR
jgi:hypothetical protein